jgi:hypothetical protein
MNKTGSMIPEKKLALYIILTIFLFSLGASLFINILSIQKNFLFADEAIYYFITQSIVQDKDLEYTKQDLIRYKSEIGADPLGVFLKKGKDDKIFFAKSFVYPLFAAPFVKFFGINGFLIFHSFLLLLILLMGYAYFSLENRPLLSLVSVTTFLFASVAIVYITWIHPDFFNLFLVFAVLFLWLYKHKAEKTKTAGRNSRISRFLFSNGSDYMAAFLAGLAVFSKPPSIAVLGPFVLYYFLKKQFIKPLVILLIFIITTGLFFGVNHLATGDWNYQGGERKTFYNEFPLEKSHLTFDTAKGAKMSTEGYAQSHLLPIKVVFYNIYYYFTGRFTGLLWYYFPAVLFLVLFLIRRKQLDQWLLFIALAGEILIYIVLMPDNYAGGGGALANRYFISIYPFFFFLPGIKRDIKECAACWVAAALFISPILVNPFFHSHFPYTHAKKPPFTWLPLEMTLNNNFPTNANPWADRQEIGQKPNHGWLYFLDDNFLPRLPELQEDGFWTRGDHKADIVLKTYYPVKELHFRLLNNRRMSNTISVKVGREKKTITLAKKQWGTITFSPKPLKIEWWHLYRIKIKASKGSLPYLEDEFSNERRYLGVYFEIDIIPEK